MKTAELIGLIIVNLISWIRNFVTANLSTVPLVG